MWTLAKPYRLVVFAFEVAGRTAQPPRSRRYWSLASSSLLALRMTPCRSRSLHISMRIRQVIANLHCETLTSSYTFLSSPSTTMVPQWAQLFTRNSAFDPSSASGALRTQWVNPSDVFSILLILGGEVIARALAQLAGSGLAPVSFSFGIY